MTLTAEVQTLAVDNEGYLLYPDDWNESVALELADSIDIEMNEERWVIVNFVREYFETNQTVPEARRALKAMVTAFGKDKATRKYLYKLFPYGYGQQACKIAGMRKPLKLMLDM